MECTIIETINNYDFIQKLKITKDKWILQKKPTKSEYIIITIAKYIVIINAYKMLENDSTYDYEMYVSLKNQITNMIIKNSLMMKDVIINSLFK